MKTWLIDIAERVVATYIQSVLGLLAVSGPLNIDAIQVALVAAIPAVLSVLKGTLARFVGDPESASLIRLDLDPNC